MDAFYEMQQQRARELIAGSACPCCGKKGYVFICEECERKKEKQRANWEAERKNNTRIIRLNIDVQNRRAKRAGLPATLTLNEWLEILDRYNWKCAYCGEQPYQAIEHKIPVTKGGGTTSANCVPACVKCNVSKSNH